MRLLPILHGPWKTVPKLILCGRDHPELRKAIDLKRREEAASMDLIHASIEQAAAQRDREGHITKSRAKKLKKKAGKARRAAAENTTDQVIIGDDDDYGDDGMEVD